MVNKKNQLSKPIFILCISLLISACFPHNIDNRYAYEEYERMIEPTNTGKDDYRDYESTIPMESVDSDGDGWNDNFDLCPNEASEDGLAGCAPLAIHTEELNFTLWYKLPIDPSGRINVFGDRFLVLTSYELGELQIFDLSDGKLLRNFQIPDLLNDSPTLLPQGILLKNYDQQRWRLLDYDGSELYTANEELEIISESNNLLVSRADNTIFIRKLNDIKTIYNQFAGRYVSFTSNGMLSITNPKACTITLLNINNFTKNESFLFSPDNEICNQSAQFSNNGEYSFFTSEGSTHLLSLQHAEEQHTYSGIPMGLASQNLLLIDGEILYQQEIPNGANNQLLDLSGMTIQKVIVDQNMAAILIRNTETFQSAVHLINLETHKTQTSLEAESIQFTENQFIVWSFGSEQISFYDKTNFQEINQLETPAISAVQTAVNNAIFLVCGQDHQLYIYGPEIK